MMGPTFRPSLTPIIARGKISYQTWTGLLRWSILRTTRMQKASKEKERLSGNSIKVKDKFLKTAMASDYVSRILLIIWRGQRWRPSPLLLACREAQEYRQIAGSDAGTVAPNVARRSPRGEGQVRHQRWGFRPFVSLPPPPPPRAGAPSREAKIRLCSQTRAAERRGLLLGLRKGPLRLARALRVQVDGEEHPPLCFFTSCEDPAAECGGPDGGSGTSLETSISGKAAGWRTPPTSSSCITWNETLPGTYPQPPTWHVDPDGARGTARF